MKVEENTRKQWESIIARQIESDEEVKSWCKSHKINVSSFYRWKKELALEPQVISNTKAFVPIQIEELKKEITLKINGVKLCFDVKLLPEVIQTLK